MDDDDTVILTPAEKDKILKDLIEELPDDDTDDEDEES